MDLDRHRVAPDTDLSLDEHDPAFTGPGSRTKKDAEDDLEKAGERLAELQEVLYAQREHKVLIVLQGMDTSGKDGAIRRIGAGMSPSGVRVASFKKPSDTELAHDFLWRVHAEVPGSGEITIFNRSHYEDVLVVRVHHLVPEEQWRRRYRHIREFERMLADEGTVIRKFFLHISRDEQRERLQARLEDKTKQWKFLLGDLDERARWDEYQRAYAEAISATSTDDAPWYVVPADHKWFRDLVVTNVLIETLEGLDLRYPPPADDLDGIKVT